MNNQIITVYETKKDGYEVEWNTKTGAVRVFPGGEWLNPDILCQLRRLSMEYRDNDSLPNQDFNYENIKNDNKDGRQKQIKDIAIWTLKNILGWREVDMPEGDRAKNVIKYIEDTAKEALERIAYLDVD